jgi:hypothetical protein
MTAVADTAPNLQPDGHTAQRDRNGVRACACDGAQWADEMRQAQERPRAQK